MPSYAEYLKVDELLALQRPLSEGPEHDEMLFIVIHQVYELWFKQILHELDHLEELLARNDGAHARGTLKRILTILKVLVAQIDILETMTPLEFLSFRDRLESGSGFQSHQFRELEFALGWKDPKALERYPAGSEVRRRLERRLAVALALGLLPAPPGRQRRAGAPEPTSSGTSPGGSSLRPPCARCWSRCTGANPRWRSCASGWWISTKGSWSGATGT